MKQDSTTRVIRAEAAENPEVAPAVALNLTDFAAEARREAQTIIAGAYNRAAAVAKESTDKACAEGFAQGRSDGYAEGLRQAREEATEKIGAQSAGLVPLAEKIIRRIASAGDDLAKQRHGELLEFAIEVAEKIVARVAPVDISTAQGNLQKALELAGRNSSITVKVNPGQLAALERYCGQLCSSLGHSGQVRLVADGTISPGGVMAGTAVGTIDATIETQLAKVVDVVLGGAYVSRQVGHDEQAPERPRVGA